jgi:chloride channel 3/4/5
MLVKAGLTVITFGIKLPAGIFIPTLGVGACAGRVVGISMQWLQLTNPSFSLFNACGGDANCIIPGLYAMVGAAATLSGVTRTTVSLAVIMFELTDTLTYAVPVMLSVLVAKTVADALEPKGIYDLVIELNQLPYLDSKHEYLWGNLQINDVTSRDAEIIKLDQKNTVKSLRAQLLSLTWSGADDSGFPILRRDVNDDDGMRMVGYIGSNELEHALSLVPDDVEDEIRFHTTYSHALASSSISSLQEFGQGMPLDPFDFTPYMDKAPLILANNSPMELLHQIFVKLGARYVVIMDTDGLYEGVIDKKTWLAFLSDLEEKS